MTGSSGTSPHSGQQDAARLVSGPSPPESQRLEVARRRARRPWRVSRDPRARRYSRTVLRDRRRPRAIARIECCCPPSSQSCFTVGRPSMDTSQGVMSPREAPTARGGGQFSTGAAGSALTGDVDGRCCRATTRISGSSRPSRVTESNGPESSAGRGIVLKTGWYSWWLLATPAARRPGGRGHRDSGRTRRGGFSLRARCSMSFGAPGKP
jgi:hypothetical protein